MTERVTHVNRSALLTVLAVLCFLVLFILAVFSVDASNALTQGLFYGGLALFAAGHLPEAA